MADEVEAGVRRLQQALADVERMRFPPHLARQAMQQAFEFLEEPTRKAIEAMDPNGYPQARLMMVSAWGDGRGG